MVSEWCRDQSSIFLMLKSQLIQDLSLHSLMFSCMTLPRAHAHLFSLIEFWGGDEEWFFKLNLRDSILDSCCLQLPGAPAVVRSQECAWAVLASRNLWGVAASALPWPGTQMGVCVWECECVWAPSASLWPPQMCWGTQIYPSCNLQLPALLGYTGLR